MHKTLYTPAMIDTFRACKRAYSRAFLQHQIGTESLSFICKQFWLRALAQINKGKISSITQLQKYMGQHWPVDRLGHKFEKEAIAKAFLYTYKTLLHYLADPYRPNNGRIVGVALNVRARIPEVKAYIEDTFDLIIWYPSEQRLEFVDFTIQPLKTFDPAWPSTSVLFKKYLAEKLQSKWPHKKLSINFQRIGLQDYRTVSVNPEESIYRLHWADVLKNLEEMQTFEDREPEDRNLRDRGLSNSRIWQSTTWQPHENCRPCAAIDAHLSRSEQYLEEESYYLTA